MTDRSRGAAFMRGMLDQIETPAKSYAQFKEDCVLNWFFNGRTDGFTVRKKDGFYVDVGANDPTFHSVTKMFYDAGWHGLNIEPNPTMARRLMDDRPRDITVNLGVSDEEGILPFWEYPEIHGWSTFDVAMRDKARAAGKQEIAREIPVQTLSWILEHYVGDKAIDFLKIDAEGFDDRIMGSMDWIRWRPTVVVVEVEHGSMAWEPGFLASGYYPFHTDGVNSFYAVR